MGVCADGLGGVVQAGWGGKWCTCVGLFLKSHTWGLSPLNLSTPPPFSIILPERGHLDGPLPLTPTPRTIIPQPPPHPTPHTQPPTPNPQPHTHHTTPHPSCSIILPEKGHLDGPLPLILIGSGRTLRLRNVRLLNAASLALCLQLAPGGD